MICGAGNVSPLSKEAGEKTPQIKKGFWQVFLASVLMSVFFPG